LRKAALLLRPQAMFGEHLTQVARFFLTRVANITGAAQASSTRAGSNWGRN
jgi:hypothetical protein